MKAYCNALLVYVSGIGSLGSDWPDGHSVAGQAENYAYLGLYWTWGGKAGDSDKGDPSFASLLPRL